MYKIFYDVIETEFDCEFCKIIDNDKIYWKKELNTTYKVALVSNNHREDGSFCGETTHKPMRLNYCPVCGKEYKEE